MNVEWKCRHVLKKKQEKRVDGKWSDNANISKTKRLNGECEE